MGTLKQQSTSLEFAQLTDLHLFAEASGQLVGIKTRDSLEAVLQYLEKDRVKMNLSALLITGDITQDGTVESYQYAHQRLAALKLPQYWVLGNHDIYDHFIQVYANGGTMTRTVDYPHWRIIVLNSRKAGHVEGLLAPSELSYLRTQIQSADDRFIMILIHHPLVPVQAPWLDKLMVQNAQEFHDAVQGNSKVRLVVGGHIHHNVDLMYQGIRHLYTGSTCVQFCPGSKRFALDRRSPGYRWIRLAPTGEIETKMVRVAADLFVPDFNKTGY